MWQEACVKMEGLISLKDGGYGMEVWVVTMETTVWDVDEVSLFPR